MNIKKIAKIVNFYCYYINKYSSVLDLSGRLQEKREESERSKTREELLKSSPEPDNQSELNIINLKSNKEDKELASELYDATGVWQHPFNQVHKDDVGFYILKHENPSGKSMSKNQLVADYAINMTPYWKITSIQGNRINLQPIEKNPFATGVGAGGAKLTQHDVKVYSGEYEKDRINKAHQAISSGNADVDDVKYLLLGTVPVQMGPNGSQGGWYNPYDVRNNRGGQKNLSEQQIIKQDAIQLKEWGFDVPKSALEGSISARAWEEWLDGNPSEKESYEFEGLSSNEIDKLISQIKHKDRRIARSSMNNIIDLVKKNKIPESILEDVVKEGGSSDYLSNEKIISYFYEEKNIDGLKLCLEKLQDNDNKEVSYLRLIELDPTFAEENLASQDNIRTLYRGFSELKDKHRVKGDFDMKNVWAVNFIKNNNLLNKIESFLKIKEDLDYDSKYKLKDLVSSMMDSFGIPYFMDNPELKIFKEKPYLIVTKEEKNIYNQLKTMYQILNQD